MIERICVALAVCALILTTLIQTAWGYFAIREGRLGRSWGQYIRDWEFALGGTLISSASMFLFFAIYASSAVFGWFDLPSRVWIYSFFVLSINLVAWCARSGYLWYGRRFSAEST